VTFSLTKTTLTRELLGSSMLLNVFFSCEYLVQKYLHSKVNVSDNTYKQKRFPHNWICLCDDDNDIEMAMFCHHAYIPSVTSESLKNIIDENPSHFTVACDTEMQREEVLATDYALRIILDTFQESSEK